MEDLQIVLQEFYSTATLNSKIMIRHFRKGLRPSIRAQLDARSREPNSGEEVVEKTVNVEAKAILQSFSNICDMDS